MKLRWGTLVGLVVLGFTSILRADPLVGQVFIATEGGPAIKLPLVPILLMRRAELEEHISKVRAKLEPERKKCYSELAEIDQKYRRASEDFRKASDAVPLNGARENPGAFRRQGEIGAILKQVSLERDRLIARRALLDSSRPYFNELPQPVMTAKTDADGRFTIELREQEEYAIVAKASRSVGSTTESYFWMVRLPVPTSKIMLSNDNLSTSGNTESLIATKK